MQKENQNEKRLFICIKLTKSERQNQISETNLVFQNESGKHKTKMCFSIWPAKTNSGKNLGFLFQLGKQNK